jgi:predicted DNA-binding protein with PD1-like motif
MIFTETRDGRRFVGEFDPGMPVTGGLHSVIANYRIGSGVFEASGYVRDPIVRSVRSNQGFGEPEAFPGRFLVVSFVAVVSERMGEPDLTTRVMLHREDGLIVAGILEEAISESLELRCEAWDDITLRRFHDPDSDLHRWLDVSVNVSESVGEVVKSGRAAMEAMPSRLLEPNEMPKLRVGDFLEHPRLGQCEVTQVVDDDRIGIKMSTGKVAQLHLGLLTLSKSERRKGRNHYSVEIRRRNR